MELTFLGTSAGAPTRQRNVSAIALRAGKSWDLFDCGEATQHQIQRTPLSLSKLRRVFISHVHGDHCFGLFGLLGSRSMEQPDTPLTVFGPAGLQHMVETVLEASATHLTYSLTFHEVDPAGERVVADEDGTVDALPLTHRVLSFGWSLHERDRPGTFDVTAAREAGVPDGPLFGQLMRGESVTVDGGRTILPSEVIGPVRPGRHLVIAGDNNDPASLFERTNGADLAVHEATFTEATLEKLPDDRGHSTAARVAAAAEAHDVGTLALTHFSPRYALDDPALRDEATAHFTGHLHLAKDFDQLNM